MLKRLLAVLAALMFMTVLAACGTESDDDAGATATDPSKPAAEGVACEYPADGSDPAKPVDPPAGTATATGTVAATISTNIGDIAAELDADRTPCTVNNFTSLAEQGYFDDTSCHRLTTEGIFVLQCGDPSATGMGGPGYTIADETDGTETYDAGVLAMAKTQAPDSGGSQFFLVYADSPLPPDYTVFGTVDEAGVKLLQGVAKKGTAEGGPDGSPKQAVTITGVTVG